MIVSYRDLGISMLTRFIAGAVFGFPLGIAFMLLVGRTDFGILPIAIGATVGSLVTTLVTGVIDARRIRRHRRTIHKVQ